MLDHHQDPSTKVEDNMPLNQRSQSLLHSGKRDLSQLEAETSLYLSLDKQRLQESIEQARQTGDGIEVRKLTRRLTCYYVVERFFLYLADHEYSTKLTDVTTDQIEDFIKNRKPLRVYKTKWSDSVLARDINSSNTWELAKVELRAFFSRAEANGVISHNPFSPLIKAPLRLEPQNLSSQNQADYLAFQEYLQRRVDHNFLSSRTAASHLRDFCILLHGAKLRHTTDPAWPTELDGLFANPRWVADWLMNLENRSTYPAREGLARGTVQNYLFTIRQIWLFLQSQGRVLKTYYSELKEMFRLDDNSLILPGRPAQIIKALSEAEEAAVFAAIERYSTNPILKQRDIALFVTGLQTTMRMDSLNSMRIENFRELEPGSWVCQVRTRRPTKRVVASADQLANDKTEWQDWYVSPAAHAAINTYLEFTHRTWQSQGPVWLDQNGQLLRLKAQENLVREYLKLAKCKFVRPYVLRHTGIDRLLNKFNLPIPTVLAISQLADPCFLLKAYARRATRDVFKDINHLFSPQGEDTSDNEKLLLSISIKLNDIRSSISRRKYNREIFSRDHVEEVLDLLDNSLTRVVKFLGYEMTSENILLPWEDYLKIETTLQSSGLSSRQILGYEPELQRQTLIKSPSGKRKWLLDL